MSYISKKSFRGFLFSICLASLLAGAFFTAGCNERKTEYTTDGRVILNFWHTYNDDEEAELKKIIMEWEAVNASWSVRPVRIPFDGHKPKLRTALTVGRGPDMARVDWSFVCELGRKHALVDLAQFGFDTIKDTYLKAPLRTNFIDGHYLGLPDQTTCVALFYNKQLFRDAGLDPEAPPKTWDEFVEIGKKITNAEKGVYACGFENTLWWSLPFFNTFGAGLISDDGKKCLLDQDPAVRALEFKRALYADHKIEAGAWRAGSITPEQGFVNGKYAMIFMGPWNLPKFKSSKLDFGVTLIPAGPAGTSTNVGGTNVVIFNSGKFPKACYDFLTYFTSPQVQARWCSKLNQMPVNLGAYDLVKFEDPHLMTFMEQLKSAVSNPVVTSYERLEDFVNPEMEAVLTGQKTASAALSSLARKVEKRVLAD